MPRAKPFLASRRASESLCRRSFLARAAALGVTLTAPGRPARARQPAAVNGLGDLVPDPERVFDLPAGFEYRVLSRAGDTMDDGFTVPARHDGMAAFPGADGRTILIRNHENPTGAGTGGAFGPANELMERVPAEKLYDPGGPGGACLGGTTTLIFNTESQALERHHLSLAGTLINCAGGATPWGSWISCEETTARAGEALRRDHGYCFEVPALAEGLVEPVPLKGLGRLRHEAIAVDPLSGCIYLTEDLHDGLLYRFVPAEPGRLAAGGKLQALGLRGVPSLDTRNWHALTHVARGEEHPVQWIDLDDVDAPNDDLRQRGFVAGAARFARGEGIAYGAGAIWFNCTSGGKAELGQIWRYTPSALEGSRRERDEPGTLALFLEPDDGSVLQNCDNLCVAPWGHLVVCEDGPEDDYLLGVTPEGTVYRIGRNAGKTGELAGSTFSPDGTTLFVNSQLAGITLAITGPWERARSI